MFSIAGAPGMFDVIIRADGPWIDGLVREQNEWLAAKKARESTGEQEEEKAPRYRRKQRRCRGRRAPQNLRISSMRQSRVGSVILAAGWRPEDASGFEDLGYGSIRT